MEGPIWDDSISVNTAVIDANEAELETSLMNMNAEIAELEYRLHQAASVRNSAVTDS